MTRLTLLIALSFSTLFPATQLARADNAPPGTAEVHDQAAMFDAQTIEQVNGIIQEIKQKFGKDLGVLTVSAIPERDLPRLQAEGKETFYENWVRHEARDAHTNGVFILIVKNPGRLQIGVGNMTARRPLPPRTAMSFATRCWPNSGKSSLTPGWLKGRISCGIAFHKI